MNARGSRRTQGFTLIEMVLAIGIAIGMLMVALYFYQQNARLRSHILEETERVAAVRLLLDRLTADLRSALAQPQESFEGQTSSLKFVKAGPWSGTAGSYGSDLKLVSYAAVMAREGTNLVVSGISRSEETVGARARGTATNAPPSPAAIALNPAGPAPADTTNLTLSTAPLLTEMIRYLRFSYWDGTSWVEAWTSRQLPRGVMVTLALEPVPDGLEAEDSEQEIFRRVVDLPAQGSNSRTQPSAHAVLPASATSTRSIAVDGSRAQGGTGS